MFTISLSARLRREKMSPVGKANFEKRRYSRAKQLRRSRGLGCNGTVNALKRPLWGRAVTVIHLWQLHLALRTNNAPAC